MSTKRAIRMGAFALAGLAGLSGCESPAELRESDETTLEALAAISASSFSRLLNFGPAMDLEASTPGAHDNFNTVGIEGCPFVSRDDKKLFIASDRPGGEGGLDIWVSTRAGPDEPWGEPVNVGAPVNSAANDFCPTLARDGHTFYFVSTREVAGSCGGGDIYVTRLRGSGEFDEPRNLGCSVNSEYNEFSPFPIPQAGTEPVLYFSSTRPRPAGNGVGGDIYVTRSRGGVFGPPELVPGINSLADDGHPNVRRDGLEIFFYSQRSDLPGAQGGPDIYVATRASTSDPWSTPVNLGPDMNSPASETRPSLSWDGAELYFGSTRQGSSDVYVTSRDRR